MKKALSLILALAMGLSICACAGAESTAAETAPQTTEKITTEAEESGQLDNEVLLQAILDEFEPITRISRPTGYTEAISEYLTKWGENHGFDTVCDEVDNVIIDIPATEGFENAATTVLQAHSDMVCVSDDPDWDGVVTTRIVDNNLYATDTSLGADDGIGIATAMVLATDPAVKHGPLRIIITVNEEGGGRAGVSSLDHKCVEDVDYMINIDSEDYGQCIVASGGHTSFEFNKPITWQDVRPDGKVAFEINLSGLKGGHSGNDIDKNRANAIKTLAYCLAWANYNSIETELCSFTGGTGITSIPSLAAVKFLIPEDQVDDLEALLDSTRADFDTQFGRTEAGYSFTWGEAEEAPEKALSKEESAMVIDFLCALRDGLNTMNTRYPGIPETSFNLYTVNVTPESETFSLMLPMRIMSRWHAQQANMQMAAIARAYGMEISFEDNPYTGWQEREGDVIAEYYVRAFKEYTGDDCEITAVHSGLECGDFASWSPTLQVISVGPTIESPHSTNEHVLLDTVAPTAGAIATLLGYIADGDLA